MGLGVGRQGSGWSVGSPALVLLVSHRWILEMSPSDSHSQHDLELELQVAHGCLELALLQTNDLQFD